MDKPVIRYEAVWQSHAEFFIADFCSIRMPFGSFWMILKGFDFDCGEYGERISQEDQIRLLKKFVTDYLEPNKVYQMFKHNYISLQDYKKLEVVIKHLTRDKTLNLKTMKQEYLISTLNK